MSDTYMSLRADGAGRYEEKRSVFLAFARPIRTEEEAVGFLREIRKQYPDARHHVYAYVLREGNKTRYSDDGEPSGTGGLPVLELLRKSGITDAVAVVVRYFGGVLLGTGGLVRAYTAAAKAAIEEAAPCIYRSADALRLQVSYADHRRIESLLAHYVVSDISYGNDVRLTVLVETEKTAGLTAALATQTGGRCAVEAIEKTFLCEKA